MDPTVTIPYWDWTRQRAVGSAPFIADLMGGDGRPSDGRLTTGPFRAGKWKITVTDMAGMPSYLTRFMGSGTDLLGAARVSRILDVVPYDAAPWNFRTDAARSFRAALEMGPHNFVHNWIGGNMAMASSPNDPIFFLHHAMFDRCGPVGSLSTPQEATCRSPAARAATTSTIPCGPGGPRRTRQPRAASCAIARSVTATTTRRCGR